MLVFYCQLFEQLLKTNMPGLESDKRVILPFIKQEKILKMTLK